MANKERNLFVSFLDMFGRRLSVNKKHETEVHSTMTKLLDSFELPSFTEKLEYFKELSCIFPETYRRHAISQMQKWDVDSKEDVGVALYEFLHNHSSEVDYENDILLKRMYTMLACKYRALYCKIEIPDELQSLNSLNFATTQSFQDIISSMRDHYAPMRKMMLRDTFEMFTKKCYDWDQRKVALETRTDGVSYDHSLASRDPYYDASRVVLEHRDYIAHHMPHNDEGSLRYWLLVVNEKARVIVALCDLSERDVGGYQYWPSNGTIRFTSSVLKESVEVTLRDVVEDYYCHTQLLEYITIRWLDITVYSGSSPRPARKHSVVQVHIRNWEDHGLVDTRILYRSIVAAETYADEMFRTIGGVVTSEYPSIKSLYFDRDDCFGDCSNTSRLSSAQQSHSMDDAESTTDEEFEDTESDYVPDCAADCHNSPANSRSNHCHNTVHLTVTPPFSSTPMAQIASPSTQRQTRSNLRSGNLTQSNASFFTCNSTYTHSASSSSSPSSSPAPLRHRCHCVHDESIFDQHTLPPIFVHCHGGVGRTGTWILCHRILLYYLEQTQKGLTDSEIPLPIIKWLYRMRLQRDAVQGPEQLALVYQFCHELRGEIEDRRTCSPHGRKAPPDYSRISAYMLYMRVIDTSRLGSTKEDFDRAERQCTAEVEGALFKGISEEEACILIPKLCKLSIDVLTFIRDLMENGGSLKKLKLLTAGKLNGLQLLLSGQLELLAKLYGSHYVARTQRTQSSPDSSSIFVEVATKSVSAENIAGAASTVTKSPPTSRSQSPRSSRSRSPSSPAISLRAVQNLFSSFRK